MWKLVNDNKYPSIIGVFFKICFAAKKYGSSFFVCLAIGIIGFSSSYLFTGPDLTNPNPREVMATKHTIEMAAAPHFSGSSAIFWPYVKRVLMCDFECWKLKCVIMLMQMLPLRCYRPFTSSETEHICHIEKGPYSLSLNKMSLPRCSSITTLNVKYRLKYVADFECV